MDPVLPCLKDARWEGRTHAVARAVWPQGSSPHMPWLAFGFDHPHSFEFITADRLGSLNTSAAALEAQALANLRERPAEWEPVSVEVADVPEVGHLQCLACHGDFFAAERLLDVGFMQEAQRRLQARGVVAGVPRRGLLMAASIDLSEEAIAVFGTMVAEEYAGGESAVISPMLFALEDGAIVAMLDSVADAVEREQARDRQAGETDDSQAPYVAVMVTRNDQGKEDLHIMAGGEDGERLRRGIEETFHQALKQHRANAAFSGHVEIVVFGYTPPAARAPIPELVEHLRGVCSEFAAQGVPPVQISLNVQNDSAFGAASAAAPATAVAPPPKPVASPPRPVASPPKPVTSSARPAARLQALPSEPPPQEERRPFQWWTDLPSWVRIGIGFLIGLIILNRILTDMIIDFLP